MSSTLILTSSDVDELLVPDELFEQVKQGFAAIAMAGRKYRGHRFPIAIPSVADDSDGMILAPALTPEIPAYAVKVNSKFPGHLPAIKGDVVLHSLEVGRILALIGSGAIADARSSPFNVRVAPSRQLRDRCSHRRNANMHAAHEPDDPETQCADITEHRVPLAGRRVLRSHVGECIAQYTEMAD